MRQFLAFSCAAVVSACSTAPTISGAPANIVDVDTTDGASDVTNVEVSPLALTPAFSSSIDDYYVRCAAGENALDVTVTDAAGPVTTSVSVNEGDAIVVAGTYWIRCLPHDFPVIGVTPHPDVGVATPGYYLVNSYQTHAVVLDTNGVPVWYGNGTSVGNVDALQPNVVSFVPAGTGPYGYSGTEDFEIHDLASGSVRDLFAVGSPTDEHELRLLPNGDYLLFTFPIESNVDLTGLGTFTSAETVANCVVQEIDTNGALVWSWSAADHVDATKESLEPAVNTVDGASVVDPFHCNSIEVDASGNLLVSMRHTNALYYVDRSTGVVQWKLGGTAYTKDGGQLITVANDPEGTFSMQHDARFQPNGDVSMFDDHGAPDATGVARGVEYAIDFGAGTASVVFQSLGIAPSQYMGSFRRFADGHSVIGWGNVPGDTRVVTEVDATGASVLDITFTGGPSYRAVKVPTTQLDIDVMRHSVTY